MSGSTAPSASMGLTPQSSAEDWCITVVGTEQPHSQPRPAHDDKSALSNPKLHGIFPSGWKRGCCPCRRIGSMRLFERDRTMLTKIKRRQITGAALMSCVIGLAALGHATPASANSCPAGKMGTDLVTSGPDKPVGVTDNV